MGIFSESANFLRANPRLIALQALGWAPSLFLLAVFASTAPGALDAIASADTAALAPMLGALIPVFLAAFVAHLFISAFVVGTSTIYVSQGARGRPSLSNAAKQLMPRYVPLFTAKLIAWLASLALIAICSFALSAAIFLRESPAGIALFIAAVAALAIGESCISIANSFIPMAVLLEKKGAAAGTIRAIHIARKNISLQMAAIFAAALFASFAVVLLSLVPVVGSAAGQLTGLVVGAYFLAAWVMFYLRFERRMKR